MPETAGPELLRDWVERAARRGPDKTWLVSAEDDRSVSYGQLRDVIGRFAAFLRQRGLGRNDRIALLANNSIEHLLCYFGVMAAGATVCTVHIEMNRNQLGNIFERLKPQLILYQDGLQLDDLLAATAVPRLRLGRWDKPETGTLFAELAHLPPSEQPPPYPPPHAGEGREGAGPDDDAIILFTSGTSATPKGVILNFREYLLNIGPLAEGFGITADDRLYDFRPFSWNSAQTLGALAVVNRGATLVLAEKFSASRFFRHLREHEITIATGNPTTINILLNSEQIAHRDSLPNLRFITSSSAPLLLEEWKRFEQKFGIPVAQGCGASEASWIAAIPGERRRLGTVGRPFAYHDLAIVDAEGRRLPAGEIGYVELGGLGDHPFRYLGDDGEVKVHSRGRFRTGDLGSLDTEGFLTLSGREKELIIRGGAKISPVEIDSFLM
ncbi:MAG TPA: class I adenylate-forming enzyme family protein, partial [Xanthobacteraceae bacterium]|nr:class I adenylate-forming enzyme family protein [Xanthobacteraceae bacterium]